MSSPKVVYQVTYFILGKPVVLVALDPVSFKATVDELRARFPNRPLYLSSTIDTTGRKSAE